MIFAAFMFALGYQKTGLGKRLGLMLVKLLGKRTLGRAMLSRFPT
ncbi:MAG: anion permease [Thermoflexales bacterium]